MKTKQEVFAQIKLAMDLVEQAKQVLEAIAYDDLPVSWRDNVDYTISDTVTSLGSCKIDLSEFTAEEMKEDI